MAYFDHAASSPLRPEAVEAVRAHLEEFGNPSSMHARGRAARKALDDARETVARTLNCSPREIIFTGSATEANNLVVLGSKGAIVTSAIEHPSILDPCAEAERSGRRVARVTPAHDGRIDAAAVELDGAGLISLILVNNEVGAIQPVAEVAHRAREAGIPCHTDAVQALGKFPIDLRRFPVDLMTVSSHKIGGPRGAGALYVREGTRLDAMTRGGGQEFGLRAGTENVAAAAGFAAAIEASARDLAGDAARMQQRVDRIDREIRKSIRGVHLNGPAEDRAPHILNLSFDGIEGEALVIALDADGIEASTGSACASLSSEPSHVLAAMGLSPDRIRGSLRLSVGAGTSEEEVDRLLKVLPGVVEKLRRISGETG